MLDAMDGAVDVAPKQVDGRWKQGDLEGWSYYL